MHDSMYRTWLSGIEEVAVMNWAGGTNHSRMVTAGLNLPNPLQNVILHHDRLESGNSRTVETSVHTRRFE